MNTYNIPKGNRTDKEYQEYCSRLAWNFNSIRNLFVEPADELVSLDGTIEGFNLITKPIPPAPLVVITKTEFMNRFTTTELATILTASKTNAGLEVYVKKLDEADSVTINGPDTIAGVNALEAAGILSAGRAVEILTI